MKKRGKSSRGLGSQAEFLDAVDDVTELIRKAKAVGSGRTSTGASKKTFCNVALQKAKNAALEAGRMNATGRDLVRITHSVSYAFDQISQVCIKDD